MTNTFMYRAMKRCAGYLRNLVVVVMLAVSLIASAVTARAESLPADSPPKAVPEKPAPHNAENQRQQEKIRASLREVMSSPDFSTEQTMWVPSLKPRPASDAPDWMKYFERFGRFLARILRAGVWILGAIAVAVLLVSLHRWWRIAGKRVQAKKINIPTHVGDLDIRSTSLPDDVGAAARQRWQAGDSSGSLSLLYRGALSSLVLRCEAPIRSSYTEAECLRVARGRLATEAFSYFNLLTRAWVQTVYAGRAPDDAAGLALCDGFASQFPSVATATATYASARAIAGAST